MAQEMMLNQLINKILRSMQLARMPIYFTKQNCNMLTYKSIFS